MVPLILGNPQVLLNSSRLRVPTVAEGSEEGFMLQLCEDLKGAAVQIVQASRLGQTYGCRD